MDLNKAPIKINMKSNGKHWIFIIYILISIYVSLVRMQTINEPLDRDIAFYSVVANELSSGKKLYSDIWANQPPGIHLTYLISQKLFGYNRTAIYAINVFFTIVILFVLQRVAWFFKKDLSSIWGPLFWALVGGSFVLEANQPNTELLINCFLLSAFVIIATSEGNPLGILKALSVGVLFTCATFYKHIVLVVPFIVILTYAILNFTSYNKKKYLKDLLVVFFVISFSWLSYLLYLILNGIFRDFYDQLVVYNRSFTNDLVANVFSGFSPSHLFPIILLPALPLLILIIIGLFAGAAKRNSSFWILLAAYSAGVFITISLPGRFYTHYYQLWLPVLVLGAAKSAQHIQLFSPNNHFLWRIPAFTCTLALFILQLPSFFKTVNDISRMKYGSIFIEVDKVADDLNLLLLPCERFFQIGSDPGLYFTSKRNPDSGILFDYPLMVGPYRYQLCQKLINDLNKSNPEVIVLSKYFNFQPIDSHPILIWLTQNYFLPSILQRYSSFYILVRKGSLLESRLVK
jgi:hypothetical protein